MAFTDDLVQRIEAARGDTRTQAALAAEFLVAVQPEPERRSVADAVDAAAILHWFDADLLAVVLGIEAEDAERRYKTLRSLSFVERYRMPGRDLGNLHESTRLGWRIRLAREAPERFRALSSRAAASFQGDPTRRARIESIYHRLCADPESAAGELARLDDEWAAARTEDRVLLAAAIRELEETGLVQGRARAWVLLVTGWILVSRGEAGRLVGVAGEIDRLAREAADLEAQSDAQFLLGEALTAQGDLAQAQIAIEAGAAICQRLAAANPENRALLRRLSLALIRRGDILESRGQLDNALAAFTESLETSRRLVELEPANTTWARDLAVAHNRVGNLLGVEDRHSEAHRALDDGLAINRRLAEADPDNSNLQREYAAALICLGDLFESRPDLESAQAAFAPALEISRRLTEQDPTNATLQWDLAVAHGRVGGVLEEKGSLTAAEAAFGEGLGISRRLVEQDPANVVWQREVATTDIRLGSVLQAQGRLREAETAFGESVAISRRLVERDGVRASHQRGLGVAAFYLARLLAEGGRYGAALPLFEESQRALWALTATDQAAARWVRERELVEGELERCRQAAESAGGTSGEQADG